MTRLTTTFRLTQSNSRFYGLHQPPRVLDLRGSRQRTDRPHPVEKQQHHSAGLPGPESAEGKKALIRFDTPLWQRRLEFAIRQWWFETTLPAKLEAAEAAWHASQPKPPEPIIVHHPIDDELQTGESRLLGGPISIHAPWSREQSDPPT